MTTSSPQENDAAATASNLPLAGIRVIEFCHTIMGPTCGLVFADLGADVIKIEPTNGDHTRRLSGFAAGFYSAFNRNKRSLAIDMKHPDGQRAIGALARTADVVVENFAAGTMDRLGCGYDALSKLNPRLIYCSLKGFLSGPYENRPALDEVVQYMAGLAYMTGPPGRPLRAGASIVDILGGTFGVVAVMAALQQRQKTGLGQFVKSSLFESTAFLVSQHMACERVAGEPVPPMPARRSAWAIYETFPTSDDQLIFIGITSDNHWRRFCNALALEDMLKDPTLETNELRVAARDRLVPLVAGIAKRHTMAELSKLLEKLEIPCSPVSRPADLFEDRHLNEGGRMMDVLLSNGEMAKLPGLPIETGEHHRYPLRYQPPGIGEHSREVLASAGYSPDEIAALEKDGVVAAP
jgi:crotonobetainyl-CoA:carnitine CoA-transferase CaiB-like acyl-CoA transferase